MSDRYFLSRLWVTLLSGTVEMYLSNFGGNVLVHFRCTIEKYTKFTVSGGKLRIVLEPHVSRNDKCVAGTAVSGNLR